MSKKMFKKTYSLDERKYESSRIIAKYEDRIPIIVEKEKTSNLPLMDRKKYLVPKDMKYGKFLFVIRRKIALSEDKALFTFINGKSIPPLSYSIGQLYDSYKDEDGFLYITYCEESTFG